MAKSRKEIGDYKKKIVELRTKPDFDKKKIAKYEEAIKVCEASIEKFDKQTDEMYTDVRRYIDEQKIIMKKLDVYKSIVSKWNRHASQVTGFVTGLALDLGSTGGGLETGLTAVASLMGTLKDYADEKFYG
jgi:phage-related tail protein